MRENHEMVTLVEAAHLMRVSYGRAFNLVLQGKVAARQRPNGRWMVSRADARRVAQELTEPETTTR